MKKTLVLLIMACVVLLWGCGSSATKTTEKGSFDIKLSSTNAELLKYGRNEVNLYVTDDKGSSIENAQLEITPWMPEHGHGTNWPPAITEQGKGLYKAVIPLTMTGHWQLKINIHKGDIQDSTVFDFTAVK